MTPRIAVARIILVLSINLLVVVTIPAQQFIQLGTGLATNGQFEFPAPYGNQLNGARHQILVLASELTAAGMTSGDISCLGFNVANPLTVPLSDMRISIGITTNTALGPAWETGLSLVFGPQTVSTQVGWNDHQFDAPFTWDGTSNLIIETCFRNLGFTVNANMFRTSTAFPSVTYWTTSNPNVCSAPFGNIQLSTERPDMRFCWNPPMVAPSAAFNFGPTTTCTGAVQFTDGSFNFPTTWTWYFGDGSTDTISSPVHVYQSDGVYDVSLVVTNAYGMDSIAVSQAVTVDLSGPRPIPACMPVNTPTVGGFGILEVAYANSVHPSADAIQEGGYIDKGCALDTVAVGAALDISIQTGNITTHNVRAWIDWDGNGAFSASETVLNASSVYSANASILVPTNAVLDTPLRLRVIADYDLAAPLAACTAPQVGQVEDYGLVVIANPLPPQAQFDATPQFSCTGVVQFTDLSLNAPTGWNWDFGDGTFSSSPSPQHTYASSGTYTVTLDVVNTNGNDQFVQVDLITVDLAGQLIPAQCTPNTQSYCCGYGLVGLQFGGIISTSADASEGYRDRSCGNVAQFEEGEVVPISVETGGVNTHDTYVWLDLDNDGTFANNELIFFALNESDPSGNVMIPSGSVFGTPLRLRVAVDVVGELTGPCDPPLYGQVEDFSAILSMLSTPPIALFTANPTTTCDGIVQFTDLSQNLIDTWDWDFGDGTFSSDPSPLHVYTVPGLYSVSLTVTNSVGNDTQTQVGLINYLEGPVCDTTAMPSSGSELVQDCVGTITDDGGVNGNYSPGTSGSVTIAPPGAETVTLTFLQFAFETNFDFLRIYDGPNTNAPLIDAFTGPDIGALPNGGVISSTGGSITLQQDATFGMINWAGFIANWNCTVVSVPEVVDPIAGLYPNPVSDRLFVDLSRPAIPGMRVTINNVLGELIADVPLQHGQGRVIFDATSWPAGAYLLSVHAPDGRWSRTVVIQ